MNVNKICVGDIKFTSQTNNIKKQENNDKITQPEQPSGVVSPICAKAITSINAPVNTPYKFIQEINLPYLNLKGNLYLLPNGQKCLIAKKEGPCVLRTYFKVGSMNENDKIRGISHFIEHNLFNGSDNLKPTEFVENVNNMGGKYNASTGFISTDYFIKSPLHKESDLEKFIKMHSDMLAHPSFLDKMLLKEKGPVISEIQMLADNPYNIANNTVFRNLFNIQSQSSDLIGGSVQNIEHLTKDDVLNYYHKHYNPQNALTILIGDVDEKKALNLLCDNFKSFKPQPQDNKYYEKLKPTDKPVRQDLYVPNTQSHIINLAFAGPQNDKEKITTEVLLLALAGYKNAKLTKEMKKINLDINAGMEAVSNIASDPTAVLISTSTPNNNTEDVLKLMYKTIHEMSQTPLTNDELQIVKNKVKNQLNHMAESNMGIASLVGGTYINENSFNSILDYEKILNSITPADVMDSAKKFLDLNKASVCVVHPATTNQISFSGNKKAKTNYEIKTYKTPNNATISTLNSPASKLCVLTCEVKSEHTSNKAPLELILNYMLQKGTFMMKEEDFADIEDRNNISSEVSVNNNSIKFDYSCPKESLPTALKNFYMNLYTPNLTPENFERAKAEIKNLYLSNPKNAGDKAYETLYEGSPRGYSLRKIYEELDKVTFEDVKCFYAGLVSNANLNINVSGNMQDNSILNTLYSTISTNGKTYNPNQVKTDLKIKELDKSKVVTDTQERNQADIVQLFRIKETGNIKDKAGLVLLNEILGGNSNSRLFNDLREKQKLAYRVNSSYTCQDNEGTLALRIFTTTENPQNPQQHLNLQKSINGFKHHIDKLINEKVSEKELEAAKLQVKSNLLFALESTAGKNVCLFESLNSLYKDKYLENLLNAIDNITVDNINTLAKYYLTKPSVISVVASQNTLDKNKEYLEGIVK
ncbi:MAG: insulinase family protein [Candidatus Gastranaerophilales bacterium]|nr:insulinase family protein [Candidatus Gastranaerophilales bacterium]